jgi:glycosyltransferase involved in cell wall biosynthesis
MKLLCISPYSPEVVTINRRTLPLLYELARYDYEIDVLFPRASVDPYFTKFKDKLNYSFLNAHARIQKPACFAREPTFLSKAFGFFGQPKFGKLFFPFAGADEIFITLQSLMRFYARKYDIVYAVKPLLRSAGVSFLLSKKWGVPVVLDLDDYDINDSYLLKKFHGLIVASRELEKIFKKYNPLYIPNSADLNFFDPSRYELKKNTTPVIVWSGIMYKTLRLEILIEAFTLMKEDAKLKFIGGGPKKQELIYHAKRAGIINRVQFMEWVEDSKVPMALAESDVGILYVSDTVFNRCKCPLKLFEYMAMELPVISTDVGEASYTIQEANCGILVPPEDPRAMAEAMDSLARNPNLRRKLGKNGRKYLVKKQNFHLHGLRLKEFIEQTVKRRAYFSKNR